VTRRSAIVAILGLAFVLRLAAVLWLADTVPFSDYLYYHMAAQKIAADWRFFFDPTQVESYGKFGWWPPVYPFTLGALYALFGANHRLVAFLQVLLGTLVCWLVYRLGRRCAGERFGLVAAGLVAVSPTYIFTTNLLASENLYVVWLGLGLLVAMRAAGENAEVSDGAARREQAGGAPGHREMPDGAARRWELASAGALFGVGALTRAIGLLVPVVVVLWLRGRMAARRAWLTSAAWMLAGTAVVIAPWTLRNAVVVGSPALVCFGGGLNFYFGHNREGMGYRDLATTPMAQLTTQAEIDRMGYRLGLEYIAEQPLGLLARTGRKIAALFGPPGYAPHGNSAILLPDGWRTDPEKGRIAAEMRARQRAKNRWLDGVFTWLAAAHSYVLLAGALVAVLRWRRLPPGLRLMGVLCLGWIGAHALFWAQPRFRYPMEIFLALLAAWVFTGALPAPAAARGGKPSPGSGVAPRRRGSGTRRVRAG